MSDFYPFVNPPLPYSYQALEPWIDEKTMHLHHDRHLQAYVDNLNKILKDFPNYQGFSLEELLIYSHCLPDNIQVSVKNNAGGVFNHVFYFEGLSEQDTFTPKLHVIDGIISSFGNFENFRKTFTDAALSVFGSGYAWLVADCCGMLKIITTANQDCPLSLNLSPVLCIDVWEHAYYLKHYNLRAGYVEDWFQVVNWNRTEENYLNCIYG